MIVCQCHVVSDREVNAAVEDGARSLGEVCRATGAGRTCGGCLFSLKRALCEHGAVVGPSIPEVAGAAS